MRLPLFVCVCTFAVLTAAISAHDSQFSLEHVPSSDAFRLVERLSSLVSRAARAPSAALGWATLKTALAQPSRLRAEPSAVCQAAAAALAPDASQGACPTLDASSLDPTSLANPTPAFLDMICRNPCTGLLIQKFKEVMVACAPEIQAALAAGASSDNVMGFNLRQGALMASLMQMVCLKNDENNYCLSLMAHMASMVGGVPGSADTSTTCGAVQTLGCCMPAYGVWAVNMIEANNLAAADQITNTRDAMRQMAGQLTTMCGFPFPLPCNIPGAAFGATVLLSGLSNATWLALSGTQQAMTMARMGIDVAAHMGVSPAQVNVTSVDVKDDKVSVSFQVATVGDTSAQAALQSVGSPITFPTVKLELAQTNNITGTSTFVSPISRLARAPPPPPPTDWAAHCVDCPEYVALSAADKLKAMWSKMEASEYKGTYPGPTGFTSFPNEWVDIVAANIQILATSINNTISESFDRFSDEYMRDHAKVIHTHGSVAAVRLDAVPGPVELSGLFAGAQHGLIRMSLVKDPLVPCLGVPNTPGCFTPGLALKMLRDGTYSSNLIAMFKLGEGQGEDYNFMKHQQKTWVPAVHGAAAEVVMQVFARAGTPPNALGNDEFAKSTPTSQDPVFPYNTYFVPNASIVFSNTTHEFRHDFGALPAGTHLYDMVIGVDATTGKPAECLCDGQPCDDITKAPGCRAVTVARLTTTSRFIASHWGDLNLFFQHIRVDKKARNVCTGPYLPDTAAFRMAGMHNAQCVEDTPRGSPHGPCAPKDTLMRGCPFDMAYNGVAMSTDSDSEGSSSSGKKSKGVSIGVLVGTVIAVAVVCTLVSLVVARALGLGRSKDVELTTNQL